MADALEDNELVRRVDPASGPLGAPAGDRDVAVAPHERRRHGDTTARGARVRERDRAVPAERVGQGPVLDHLDPEPLHLLGRHAGVPQARSKRPPRRLAVELGEPRDLEEADVPGLQPLAGGETGLEEGHRVRHRDRGPAAQQVGPLRSDHPPDHRAPVVADEVHRGADVVDQRGDVADEVGHPVVAAPARPRTRGVAALVERERADPGLVQDRRDQAPGGAALGEAVEQHDGHPVERALVEHGERQAVVLELRDPLGHGHSCAPWTRL